VDRERVVMMTGLAMICSSLIAYPLEAHGKVRGLTVILIHARNLEELVVAVMDRNFSVLRLVALMLRTKMRVLSSAFLHPTATIFIPENRAIHIAEELRT